MSVTKRFQFESPQYTTLTQGTSSSNPPAIGELRHVPSFSPLEQMTLERDKKGLKE